MSANPNRVVLRPPVKRNGRCTKCELHPCELTTAGTLPCEGLTELDLWVAEQQGELQDLVWWMQLPKGVTVEMLLGNSQRSGVGE